MAKQVESIKQLRERMLSIQTENNELEEIKEVLDEENLNLNNRINILI